MNHFNGDGGGGDDGGGCGGATAAVLLLLLWRAMCIMLCIDIVCTFFELLE